MLRAEPPIVLADGTSIPVRAVTAGDRAQLGDAVAGLGEHSRYMRFGTVKPRLTERELTSLTRLDHVTREALAALHPRTGAFIAVARYAPFPGRPGTAEIAVAVGDHWQHRGLGTALAARLAEHARAAGLDHLRATVLSENRAALALLRRFAFAPIGDTSLTREFERDLATPPAPLAPA